MLVSIRYYKSSLFALLLLLFTIVSSEFEDHNYLTNIIIINKYTYTFKYF